jgi:hypothetical protein
MSETSHIARMAVAVFTAMNKRDFADYEQLITDDVVFDFPGAGRAEGSRRTLQYFRDGIISYISNYFKDTSFTL